MKVTRGGVVMPHRKRKRPKNARDRRLIIASEIEIAVERQVFSFGEESLPCDPDLDLLDDWQYECYEEWVG